MDSFEARLEEIEEFILSLKKSTDEKEIYEVKMKIFEHVKILDRSGKPLYQDLVLSNMLYYYFTKLRKVNPKNPICLDSYQVIFNLPRNPWERFIRFNTKTRTIDVHN